MDNLINKKEETKQKKSITHMITPIYFDINGYRLSINLYSINVIFYSTKFFNEQFE